MLTFIYDKSIIALLNRNKKGKLKMKISDLKEGDILKVISSKIISYLKAGEVYRVSQIKEDCIMFRRFGLHCSGTYETFGRLEFIKFECVN